MRIRLTELRKAAGRTLEEIANDLDLATSTVQRWEAGETNIPTKRLPDIAAAYHCRINAIFDDPREETVSPLPPEIAVTWHRIPPEDHVQALRTLQSFAAEGDSEIEGLRGKNLRDTRNSA